MKKILFILLVVVFASCIRKEQYEVAIDRYLQEHLKDPDSYQNVELGEPKKITPMTMVLTEALKRAKAGEFPYDSISSKLEEAKAFFKSQGTSPYETLGWDVHHKYRAKNSFGAMNLEEVTYIFDKSQKEILRVESKNEY